MQNMTFVITGQREQWAKYHIRVSGRQDRLRFERFLSLWTVSLDLQTERRRFTAHEKCPLENTKAYLLLLWCRFRTKY